MKSRAPARKAYAPTTQAYDLSEDLLRESEEKYRELVENLNDIIFSRDANGIMAYISPVVEPPCGFHCEEIVGRPFAEFVHPDDLPAVLASSQRTLAGHLEPSEFRVVTKSRGIIWVRTSSRPIIKDGDVVGLRGMTTDITEQKRAESQTLALLEVSQDISGTFEIQELLERVQTRTAERLPCDMIGIFYWDAARHIFRLASHYGLPDEMQADAAALELAPGEPFDGILKGGETIAVNDIAQQSWLPTELLTYFSIRAFIAAPLYVRGREPGTLLACSTQPGMGFDADQVKFCTGIAQQLAVGVEAAELYQKQKDEAEQLKRAEEEAEGANRAKSEFLSTMSHELRTPLSVILGYTDLLLEGGFGSLDAEQIQAIRRIDINGRELLDLIVAVLDLSRLEAGRLPVEVYETDVATMIQDVRAEMQDLQDQSGLTFIWDIDTDLPVIRTDAGKLKIIVRNLIGNAVKFTEYGSVTISAQEENSGVSICVTDTGIGMTQEELPLIFEPFHQVDRTTTSQYSGTGLGLNIVKRLLEVLHGQVTVSSEPGQGSTFHIWLPGQTHQNSDR